MECVVMPITTLCIIWGPVRAPRPPKKSIISITPDFFFRWDHQDYRVVFGFHEKAKHLQA
jgi:hypothetical protein